MSIEFITEYLDKLINENESYLVCTVYDLRVRNKVMENEVDDFLKYAKIRLENLGYQVYFTGARFKIGDEVRIVKTTEYMIAIKES